MISNFNFGILRKRERERAWMFWSSSIVFLVLVTGICKLKRSEVESWLALVSTWVLTISCDATLCKLRRAPTHSAAKPMVTIPLLGWKQLPAGARPLRTL